MDPGNGPVVAVGFTPSQTIPAGAILRLTFGKSYGALSGFGVYSADQWAANMADVWAVLSRAGLYTTTPANVIPNSTTATIDARNHVARTGAEIINAVAAIDNYYVALTRAELLTAAKAAVASTNVGAAQRDATTAAEVARQVADSWWTKLVAGLAASGVTLKWALIVAALVLVLLAYRETKR